MPAQLKSLVGRRCPVATDWYGNYLQSAHWLWLRAQCFVRDGFACVVCGGPRHLQAHHKHYRARPEDTRLEDLETRCRKHHDRFHTQKKAEKRASHRREQQQARRREAAVDRKS